jgi:hypothetical protein
MKNNMKALSSLATLAIGISLEAVPGEPSNVSLKRTDPVIVYNSGDRPRHRLRYRAALDDLTSRVVVRFDYLKKSCSNQDADVKDQMFLSFSGDLSLKRRESPQKNGFALGIDSGLLNLDMGGGALKANIEVRSLSELTKLMAVWNRKATSFDMSLVHLGEVGPVGEFNFLSKDGKKSWSIDPPFIGELILAGALFPIRLPKGEVGRGARWRVEAHPSLTGVSSTRPFFPFDYELVDVTPLSAHYKTQVLETHQWQEGGKLLRMSLYGSSEGYWRSEKVLAATSFRYTLDVQETLDNEVQNHCLRLSGSSTP